ncbi:luciferase domain-containing protein [Phaeobacter inhibens]|uniref:luciferase domain-containing protein n=1 Tax=Phaeobacter inhibens TaxID=221822 RepID=UPI0021A30591|nr:luciferase family protein [Phaeobacter inhibens]UWR98810.1 DUF5519 family protein [Phaeobacter inhibens]
MSNTLNLPKRVGPKPDTTHGLPHSQVTQHGPDHIVDQMREWAFSLPCVENRDSLVSVPGARAMVMHGGAACNHDAFMIGREFAHIHPHPDNGSMHVQLPHHDALEVVEKGWGEHHTLVLAGRRPVGLVMVFSPRDEAELDTIKTILSRSYEAVTGQKIAA